MSDGLPSKISIARSSEDLSLATANNFLKRVQQILPPHEINNLCKIMVGLLAGVNVWRRHRVSLFAVSACFCRSIWLWPIKHNIHFCQQSCAACMILLHPEHIHHPVWSTQSYASHFFFPCPFLVLRYWAGRRLAGTAGLVWEGRWPKGGKSSSRMTLAPHVMGPYPLHSWNFYTRADVR